MTTKKLDNEPKWVDLVPLFCSWLEEGNDQQKDTARKAMMDMAKVSDAVRQAQKAGDKTLDISIFESN